MTQCFCLFQGKKILLSVSFEHFENPDKIRIKLQTDAPGKIQTKIEFYLVNMFPDIQIIEIYERRIQDTVEHLRWSFLTK